MERLPLISKLVGVVTADFIAWLYVQNWLFAFGCARVLSIQDCRWHFLKDLVYRLAVLWSETSLSAVLRRQVAEITVPVLWHMVRERVNA